MEATARLCLCWDRSSLGAVSRPRWALARVPQSPAFPSRVPPDARGPSGLPVASQVEEEMGFHHGSLPPGVRSSSGLCRQGWWREGSRLRASPVGWPLIARDSKGEGMHVPSGSGLGIHLVGHLSLPPSISVLVWLWSKPSVTFRF